MKTQIDPFIAACISFIAFSLVLMGCLAYTDVKETEIKANLIKEAIQKGWTPEQVKEILKTR
jgi:hypothetical protein